MPVSKKKKDQAVHQIFETLQREYRAHHPRAKIDVYRYNPASIRIRIIDPDFKSINRWERESLIDPILDTLSEDIQSEITFLLLLTPEDCKTSLGNMDFENPIPSLL